MSALRSSRIVLLSLGLAGCRPGDVGAARLGEGGAASTPTMPAAGGMTGAAGGARGIGSSDGRAGGGGAGGLAGGPAVQIAAGHSHTCALLANGTVKCWGFNSNGQLGDGTTTDRALPTAVSGLADVAEIATGRGHTCARLTDGAVKCWGANQYGQLGNGTTTETHVPTAVPALSSVVQIAVGDLHSCARLTDGTVECWGYNAWGEYGNGTTTERHEPTIVVALAGVAQLALGGTFHACARLPSTTVECWGVNDYGQLGDGTTTDRLTPAVVPGLADVADLTVGEGHSCARLADGTARCWGKNSYGELGDGTMEARYLPTAVTGLSGVSQLALGGDNFTCAVLTDGTARCWGANKYGQLGYHITTVLSLVTPNAVEGLSSAVDIAAGFGHTCARLNNGAVACLGSNAHGQVGDGTGNIDHHVATLVKW